MLKMLRTALIHTFFRMKRPMTLGVRILATNEEGQICLVRHTYVQGWHLPGGGVERGETGLQAALKEAREEAGLLIAPSDMTLRSIHTNFESFRGDHVLFYVASKWIKVATNVAHEIADCRFFDPLALPEDTTPATRRRIGEWMGEKISEKW
jgi:8-oxo-dGTP pyrophosphatase MutT (NUDIX family)